MTPGRRTVLIGVAVAAVTLLLRGWSLDTAYDVFVDEITYLRLGESFAFHLSTDLYGQPFYLHPPAFFALEAVPLRFWIDPDAQVLDAVLAMRWLNVALAAVSAVLVWRLVEHVAGRRPGLVAAGLFALDPFVVRLNSRVLLETASMAFVLAGIVALLPVLDREDHARLSRHSWRTAVIFVARLRVPTRAIQAGMWFGLALLTKDTTAFLTLAPLFVAAILSTLQLRTALAAAGTAILVYLPYPLYALARGEFGTFLEEKGVGVLRLLGEVQLTGFNTSESVSFSQRLVERLDTFGTTYAIIGLGAVAAAWLWWRGRPSQRTLATWALSPYALAAYTVLRGTLEEQLFYFLVVPSMVVLVIAVAELRARHPGPRARRVAITAIAGLTLFTVLGATTWTRVHTRDDAAFLHVRDFVEAQLPRDVVLGTTSDISTFAIDPRPTLPIRTLDDLARSRTEYVVISTKSVRDGTVDTDEDVVAWLDEHGVVVFEAEGSAVGTLKLVLVRQFPSSSA